MVLGAPLVIDADGFKPVTGGTLREALSRDLPRDPKTRCATPFTSSCNHGHQSQAAVVHYALEPLAVELRDVAIPEIGDSDVLLQVGAVSVCGSDVHQAHNTHSWPVNVPVVLGHEFGGTVAQAGRSVKASREGDRVVRETAAEVCGACLLCRTGRYNLCPQRKGFGYGINGAMASYVKVPARCLHPIPDSLPFELACLAEPHAVAYNSMCVNSRSARAIPSWCSGPGRLACCARAWRRSPAPTR